MYNSQTVRRQRCTCSSVAGRVAACMSAVVWQLPPSPTEFNPCVQHVKTYAA